MPADRSRSAAPAPRRGGIDPRSDRLAVLSKEVRGISKPHGGRLRVALAFPNAYFVGMSNLGLQTVYRLFNADDRVVCERVFLPVRSATERGGRRPELVTLESGTPVSQFDVFAFSVSFEWDYTNVVAMLRMAGLDPRANRRRRRDPLVVIGGAVTFVNPEPLAPFADVIAAGDGELLVPALVDGFAGLSQDDREGLLDRLSASRGFYVPSRYDAIYDGQGKVAAIVPRPGSGAPPVVRKAALKATDLVDPPATTIFTRAPTAARKSGVGC